MVFYMRNYHITISILSLFLATNCNSSDLASKMSVEQKILPPLRSFSSIIPQDSACSTKLFKNIDAKKEEQLFTKIVQKRIARRSCIEPESDFSFLSKFARISDFSTTSGYYDGLSMDAKSVINYIFGFDISCVRGILSYDIHEETCQKLSDLYYFFDKIEEQECIVSQSRRKNPNARTISPKEFNEKLYFVIGCACFKKRKGPINPQEAIDYGRLFMRTVHAFGKGNEVIQSRATNTNYIHFTKGYQLSAISKESKLINITEYIDLTNELISTFEYYYIEGDLSAGGTENFLKNYSYLCKTCYRMRDNLKQCEKQLK